MDLKFQILLIIIIIFLLFLYNKPSTENFDARVSDVSKEKCGDMCTKIYGCSGFSYDKDNQKCYLSTNPIIGAPIDSMTRDENNPEFSFCNKPFPIKDEVDENIYQALPKNTVYTCQDGDEGITSSKSIINEKIDDISSKEAVVNIEPYKLKPLTWPYEKKDLDPNYVTKDDYINKMIMFDYDPYNEYQGSYLLPHKCVSNIPLFNCLTKCTIEDGCVGVEFNPSLLEKQPDGKFIQRKNVCCLKSSEFNKIKRTKEHENGAYYRKNLETDAYLSKIYIRDMDN
jgi:hypothetical protein